MHVVVDARWEELIVPIAVRVVQPWWTPLRLPGE